MQIKIIIAQSVVNGVIGKDGALPWRLPKDLENFKTLTQHHNVVMGRKTWESIRCKPLPNRENFVLTRSRNKFEGAHTFHSIQQFLACDSVFSGVFWVIGGSELYRQFLPLANELCITHVLDNEENPITGDTYSPIDDTQNWRLMKMDKCLQLDNHSHDFIMCRYVRR